MAVSVKAKLFLILFITGMLGVLSVLLLDFSALIELIPEPQRSDAPRITFALKLLSLVQPSILLALAVLGGVSLASKLSLHSPAAEALAAGENSGPALKRQTLPGLIGGTVGAFSILLITALFKPSISPQIVERIAKFGNLVPVPTRLLYGGICEELLLRWGFMTLLVWLGWRFLQKRRAKPSTSIMVTSILVSAIVFGAGHLGVAHLLIPESNAAVTTFVILANSAFGICAGFLYWRKGLESAIIAHMCCHLWLFVASLTGFYWS